MSHHRCPQCGALFAIPREVLDQGSEGASCCRCGSLFSIDNGALLDPAELDPAALSRLLKLRPEYEIGHVAPDRDATLDPSTRLQPLPTLPDPQAAFDRRLAEPEPRRRGFWVYSLLAVLLAVALATQALWPHRDTVFERLPALQRVCQLVTCEPTVVHAPGEFRVLQRGIGPSDAADGWLKLRLSFRNDAEGRQHYPELQLSLLDNQGRVLVRRRLAPREYLSSAPAPRAVLAPGEVVSVALDFRDPGRQATGFAIDFH
jgi:hypothetical protein